MFDLAKRTMVDQNRHRPIVGRSENTTSIGTIVVPISKQQLSQE